MMCIYKCEQTKILHIDFMLWNVFDIPSHIIGNHILALMQLYFYDIFEKLHVPDWIIRWPLVEFKRYMNPPVVLPASRVSSDRQRLESQGQDSRTQMSGRPGWHLPQCFSPHPLSPAAPVSTLEPQTEWELL